MQKEVCLKRKGKSRRIEQISRIYSSQQWQSHSGRSKRRGVPATGSARSNGSVLLTHFALWSNALAQRTKPWLSTLPTNVPVRTRGFSLMLRQAIPASNNSNSPWCITVQPRHSESSRALPSVFPQVVGMVVCAFEGARVGSCRNFRQRFIIGHRPAGDAIHQDARNFA